jgi:hypothetical protein
VSDSPISLQENHPRFNYKGDSIAMFAIAETGMPQAYTTGSYVVSSETFPQPCNCEIFFTKRRWIESDNVYLAQLKTNPIATFGAH